VHPWNRNARPAARRETAALGQYQAMFEEMEKTAGFSEARLKERMLEIDLRDGKRDGRLAPSTGNKCPDCGHIITKVCSNCSCCGAKLTGVT